MKKYLFSTLCMLLLLSIAFAATSPQSSLITVQFISQTPDPASPGGYIDLRFRVTNLGGKSDDYLFEIKPTYPFSADESYPAIIDKLSVGSYESSENGAVLFYRLRIAADAVEGTDNTVTLVYYKKGSMDQAQIEVPIRLESRQGLVEIADAKLVPSQPSVGTSFMMNLSISNLGSRAIEDVKVSLVTEGTPFTPIGSSNQKTIKLIAGDSQGSVLFNYFVDANAEVKVHAIPILISYYDNLNRLTNISTKIGLPVVAKPSYLYNLEKTDIITAKTTGDIAVSISNIGKGDINFVVLELVETDDYEVLSSQKSYLGNLESDDFETGQFTLNIKQTDAASVPLQLKLYYRDAYDQQYTDTITLDHKLYSQTQAQELGLVQGGSFGFVWIVVGILAILAIWWWVKKKKK